MPSNRSRAHVSSCLVAAGLLAAIPGAAAQPPASRGGGLVPGTSTPATRATREELLRSWDLDGNGSISKPEADIARARMRRQRLEMQLGAGIDPLTGLPRGVDGAADETGAAEPEGPVFVLPPELPPGEPSAAKAAAPPGSRAPGTPLPKDGGMASSRPPSPAGVRGQRAEPQAAAPLSARASWLPPQRLTPAVTGGVRAGAPAAVPGYGAEAWSDLNAGRRQAPLQPSSPSSAAASSGGLLPTIRQPGRTGAIILPAVPGRSPRPAGQGLPPPAAPSIPPPPRMTADELGVELP